ncbi:hypothetical protein OG427_07185 [Streptomyces sp. NBC_00133]|uniref:hypothetical protein n=1 Tax=Streptomyces sp. NBC_00133 TaxID=2903624 RepID=UPI0032445266
MNPDFELYDNVGRSADPIHAYNTLTATTDDLYRWARRDAKTFLAQQPLPGTPLPTPSARPYLAALNNARTPAEASAVTNALLDATEPVLEAIGTYLAAAAKWQDPVQDRGGEGAGLHAAGQLGPRSRQGLAAVVAAHRCKPAAHRPGHGSRSRRRHAPQGVRPAAHREHAPQALLAGDTPAAHPAAQSPICRPRAEPHRRQALTAPTASPPVPLERLPTSESDLSTPPSDEPTTPSDPAGHFVYGRALLALTGQLNGTESYEDAATLVDQVLEPIDGLLERLAEFFETAGEKAKESEQDDGFDLSGDFEDAAAEVRRLGESLHVAVDRMRALAAPPRPSWQAQVAAYYATAVAPTNRPALAPASARPGRTR